MIKKIVKWSVIGFVGFTGFCVAVALMSEPPTPEEIEARKQAELAQQVEEALAKAEREAKQAEEERLKAAAEKAERERLAYEKSENRRKGFHCLSGWDGSHSQVTQWLKKNLKDPKSYEHIETRVLPVNDKGLHFAFVQYRAKNSFGGYVIGNVSATYKNSDCSVTKVTSM
jgi:hypothetical protein